MQAPFTEIVVPLDGSPTAERAMGPALDLSRRTGVPLRVLSRALPGEKEELTTYLAGVADRYAALADVETLVTGRDDVAAAIVDGLEPGSLVCMSSHGRTGVVRAALGSVAEAVMRTLRQPALVGGPDVSAGRARSGGVFARVGGWPPADLTLGPAAPRARILAGVVPGPLPYSPPPGYRTATDPTLDRAIQLGNPWRFYRQFWAAHGLPQMPHLYEPEETTGAGAILTVPKGELEAARAIGMSRMLVLRRVLAPQTARFALPGLGNVWQLPLNDTSLISVTGLVEIMRQSHIAAGSTRQPFTFYLVAAALYRARARDDARGPPAAGGAGAAGGGPAAVGAP